MRGSSNGLTLIEIFKVPPLFTSEASTLLGAANPSKPYAVAVVAPSAVAYAKILFYREVLFLPLLHNL